MATHDMDATTQRLHKALQTYAATGKADKETLRDFRTYALIGTDEYGSNTITPKGTHFLNTPPRRTL